MEQNSNKEAAKSGVVYAGATMISTGIAFFSTVIFARIMNQADFGAYNNFISWYNILNVLSLHLYASFISARRDFSDQYNSYVKSMCILNVTIVTFFYVIFAIFSPIITKLIRIDFFCLTLLFLYIALYQFFLMFQTNERFAFRYKLSPLLLISCSIVSMGVSWFLVSFMKNQFRGRVFGVVIPNCILGIIAFFITMKRKGKVSVTYWRYAIPVCVPFIPHLLSLSLLNSLDKTMITSMVGIEETAVYSIAYTCGSVISLVVGMLNNAFAPWMAERLENGKQDNVRVFSKWYIAIFQLALFLMLLIAPELVYLLGGNKYKDAILIIPSILVGCSMQLIYTMYVNVEQYYKKTKQMAIMSVFAAVVNFILNYYFIPRYGYQAAAMTTMISYLMLALGHVGLSHVLDISIYSTALSMGVLCIDVCLVFVFRIVYRFVVMRVILIILSVLFICVVIFAYRKRIVGFVKSVLK